MKNWDEILISVTVVISAVFLFYGFKKAAFRFDLEIKNVKLIRFFTNIYYKSKKILWIFIFAVLLSCFYLLFGNFIFSLFVSLCLGIYLIDFFNGLEEKRKTLLNVQLVEFISNMTVLLKAGKTVRSIFKDSAGRFKDPLRTHLYKTANELELNSTLDEALDNFSEGCRSREVDLLTSSLKINSKIGGNMISMLNAISESVRHNLRVKSQAKTMILQSRYSGNIISLFPVVVLIAMCIFIDRTLMEFFSMVTGKILLIIGGILEVTGIIVIKKIISSGEQ
jgi:Flp pilus assembly protein TadB